MTRWALEDDADFVVVGTGAGGATAARVLSEAGHSVLMVEEGAALRPEERARPLLTAMGQSLRDMATVTTSGLTPMPLLQGRCVGGSTAVNSGIIWRLPEDVRNDWSQRFGLGHLVQHNAMERIFERIETELGVAPVRPEVLGGNGALMERAARALGLTGRPVRRNAANCRGSARCLQGCPNGARQSMDVAYIPRALENGARLHTRMRAERIEIEHGRAKAVTGVVLDPDSRRARGRFRIAARRAVIVAAGAIYTPVILWRSGLRGLVGERYQTHPGAAVVGAFDEQVGMGYGTTQSYEVLTHALGFKLESLSLPPELLAARLPGAGEDWQRMLRKLDTFAQWAAVVRMQSHGRVRPGRGDGVRVQYEPTAGDMERLKQGVALVTRMMFAAGAQQVYPGIAGLPEVLHKPEDVQSIFEARIKRRDFHLMASHHFGTACAGRTADDSVVSPTLETHAVRGLFVMDASVFPTNLGVNPQHSIMAVVHRAAEWLADTKSVRAAA